jgi:hypothetical protein
VVYFGKGKGFGMVRKRTLIGPDDDAQQAFLARLRSSLRAGLRQADAGELLDGERVMGR